MSRHKNQNINVMWIETEPLQRVIGRLQATRLSQCGIESDMWARLTKRLLSAEVVPGGPYRDLDGTVSVEINTLIATFFEECGYPLPGLRTWLVSQASDSIVNAKTTAATVRHDIEDLPISLRPSAILAWERIKTADRHGEISLITQRFAESIAESVTGGSAVRSDTVRGLSVANYYAWMAYTIYDDFIDGEGSPPDLAVANTAHRRSFDLYRRASPDNAVVMSCFDAMDAANAWELANCRYRCANGFVAVGAVPDFENYDALARRAGAHVLGPTLISDRLGLSDHQKTLLRDVLDGYLIARQFNDDLHDWVEDLAVGHVSPVIAYLLAAEAVTRGVYDIDLLTRRLKRRFWDGGMAALCDIALDFLTGFETPQVQELLASDSPFITLVIDPLKKSLSDSKGRIADQHRFMHAYANAGRV